MVRQIMKKIIFLLLSTIALSSFPSHANAGSAFAIFLSTSKDADLEQMKLSNEPFITDVHITKYIWKTHEIVLSEEGIKQLRRFIETRPEGKQFVVMADGARCYVGAFWQSIYSSIYSNPVILVDSPSHDRIKIERAYPSDEFARGKDLSS
jgi:hypothetical protein